MNTKMNGIAIFDLDGTITKKDTFIDFIIFCRGRNYFIFGFFILIPWIFLLKIRLYPNHKLKEKFFKFYLSNFSTNKLNKLGNLYGEVRLPDITYKEAIKQINWHKQNQHRVIVLTASSPIWLSKWCENMNIELIGTEYIIKGNKYIGKIAGKNCYGIEKKKIVQELLNHYPSIETYGYGDSKADKLFINSLKHRYYKPIWTIKK